MKWCSLFLLWLGLSLNCFSYDTFNITNNSDDGNELNRAIWYENGADAGIGYLGSVEFDTYEVGLRYNLSSYNQGDIVNYARLRFPALGSDFASTLTFKIEGAMQINPDVFSQANRPSQILSRTRPIYWTVTEAWKAGLAEDPLWYETPNLAPIINSILNQANWGSVNKYILLIISIESRDKKMIRTDRYEKDRLSITNYLKFDDYYTTGDFISTTELDLFRSVYDTFLMKESVGRVTNITADISCLSLLDLDVFIEYGYFSGQYVNASDEFYVPGYVSINITIDELVPNHKHYYRIVYKKHGLINWSRGPERSFYTQRATENGFKFAIVADSHIPSSYFLPKNQDSLDLLDITLNNIKGYSPDFMLSMGDFAITESYGTRYVSTQKDALWRYLLCINHYNNMRHSIPLFLCLGNHEGEQAWYLGGQYDSMVYYSFYARLMSIMNAYPNFFYNGNYNPFDGQWRQDYFCWVWGDALFIVLDPYHYTTEDPHGIIGGDGWRWTLGEVQYNFLYAVLDYYQNVKWKFIFMHHMTSSIMSPYHPKSGYGRGGIEIVKHVVDGNPTFEWGGEDKNGNLIFDEKRPRWLYGPIHDFLVDKNVNIVFHGHDHFFAKQILDGIIYQECPKPNDEDYDYGFKLAGEYTHGDFLPNSGFILVTVNGDIVQVDYVRSYLPGDGNNGEISYSYTLGGQ